MPLLGAPTPVLRALSLKPFPVRIKPLIGAATFDADVFVTFDPQTFNYFAAHINFDSSEARHPLIG